MKKFLKLYLLIFFTFFLTGYTWKDFSKDYPSIANSNLECVYTTNDGSFGIYKITYKIANNGFTVQYDGNPSSLLFRKDSELDGMEVKDRNGYSHYYDLFSYPTFFSSLADNNKCLSTIYMCKEDDSDDYYHDRTDNNDVGAAPRMKCVEYQNKITSSNKTPVAGSDNKACYNVNANSCEHYQDNDFNGRTVYIEIGQDAKGNYFGISYDNFASAVLSNGLDHLTSLYNDNFYVYDNDVYPKDGKYLDKIYLSFTNNQGTVSYYIASKKDDSNGGDFDLDDYNERKDYYDSLGNIQFNPENPRLEYSSLCSNDGIRKAVRIIGYILSICKWVVPLIIMVLGMLDYGKAMMSNDEKALSKATTSLLKRFVAGVVVILTPTIILAIMNAIKVTNNIENDEFGACTTCLLKPSECGKGMGTGGGGIVGGGAGRR